MSIDYQDYIENDLASKQFSFVTFMNFWRLISVVIVVILSNLAHRHNRNQGTYPFDRVRPGSRFLRD